MKKILALTLSLILGITLTSCVKNEKIVICSREEGSGTRTAFVELFGIEKDKKDLTSLDAVIASATDVMLVNVSTNKNAIGYISLGSLNDTVKAISIEGIAPTIENVQNKTYPISRPFNIAVTEEIDPLAEDFITFILSKTGQDIINKSYIPVDNTTEPYENIEPPYGKITVGGSSSVFPIMEKLVEAYLGTNPSAEIELQVSDSTAGANQTIEGIYDIGMLSRDLKESELESLFPIQIATDGIAVILNPSNKITNLQKEEVKLIFTGEKENF